MIKLVVLFALVAVAWGGVSSGDPKLAKILKSQWDSSPEGPYLWAYETENGISAQEQGVLKDIEHQAAIVSQGVYHWLTPEGQSVDVHYTADENGYQPSGAILPTPHPIPEVILKSLKYIAEHPEAPTKEQKYRV